MRNLVVESATLMERENSDSSLVLSRYVAILDVVAGLATEGVDDLAPNQGLGVTEVSEALGISKGTISRYLRRLEEAGLLIRLPNRRYILSTRIYRWGQAAAPERDIRLRIRPSLERLTDLFGESSSLFVLDDDAAMCIDWVEGRYPLRLAASLGRRLPLNYGSAPRLLLAFAPEELQQRILARAPFPQVTPNTITTAAALERALIEARESDIVISKSETNAGVIGISIVIRNAQGDVCAAIGTAGPVDRMTDERQAEVIAKLRAEAAISSRLLGYLGDGFSANGKSAE